MIAKTIPQVDKNEKMIVSDKWTDTTSSVTTPSYGTPSVQKYMTYAYIKLLSQCWAIAN